MSRLYFDNANTFCRGAGSSKGRTSWTAKAELADYISFAGFVIHYLQVLAPCGADSVAVYEEDVAEATLTPIPSAALPPPLHFTASGQKPRISLILGGYSYGSMITSHLPPTSEILSRFTDPAEGSAEAEIKLRASRLANEWNHEEERRLNDADRGRSSNAPEARRSYSHSIVVGGEESEPGTRRSHESRRSIDSFRRSFDVSRKSFTRHRWRDRSSNSTRKGLRETGGLSFDIHTSYLLVSPLLPPIAALATLFTSAGLLGQEDGCEKLVRNPCLAIYGEKDGFTSSRKIAKWAEELSSRPDSMFQARQISNAGHFWQEEGVMEQLIKHVEQFVDETIGL